jgi:hypothetical protein
MFTNTVDIGGETVGARTATEIKMLYATLDEFTNELETNFQSFINQLKYFFDRNLVLNHGANAAELAKFRLTVKFDRDMTIDTSTYIEDVLKMKGEVSQQSLDEWNPMVQSHEEEEKRREAERAASSQRTELEENALFGRGEVA